MYRPQILNWESNFFPLLGHLGIHIFGDEGAEIFDAEWVLLVFSLQGYTRNRGIINKHRSNKRTSQYSRIVQYGGWQFMLVFSLQGYARNQAKTKQLSQVRPKKP
jgi:hypothetical protein